MAKSSPGRIGEILQRDEIRNLVQCSSVPHDKISCQWAVFQGERGSDNGVVCYNSNEEKHLHEPMLYAMGSQMKRLIAFCVWRIIEDKDNVKRELWVNGEGDEEALSYLKWNRSAFEVFNDLRRKRGKSQFEVEYPPNATVHELLLHMNALPNLDCDLFEPSGRPRLDSDLYEASGRRKSSESSFLAVLKNRLTERPRRGYHYENANYVLAAFIVELAIDRPLAKVLKILVLDFLKMKNTILDHEDFQKIQPMNIAWPYFAVSSDRVVPLEPINFLKDTVHLACGGGFTCAEDMIKLYEYLLDDETGDIEEAKTKRFKGLRKKISKIKVAIGLTKPSSQPSKDLRKLSRKNSRIDDPRFVKFKDGPEIEHPTLGQLNSAPVLLGRLDFLHSSGVSDESLDKLFIGQQNYELGRIGEGHVECFTKGGSVCGYTSYCYFVPSRDLAVVVMTNCCGGADVASHVGQYILQEVLGLTPAVPFKELKECVCSTKDTMLTRRQEEDANAIADARDMQPSEREKLFGTYRHSVSNSPITMYDAREGHLVAEFGEGAPSKRKFAAMRVVKVSNESYVISRKDFPSIDRFGLRFSYKDNALHFAQNKGEVKGSLYLRSEK